MLIPSRGPSPFLHHCGERPPSIAMRSGQLWPKSRPRARPGLGQTGPVDTRPELRGVGPHAVLAEVADSAAARSLAAFARAARVPALEVVPGARTVLFDGVDDPESLSTLLAGWVPDAAPEPRELVELAVVYDGPDLEQRQVRAVADQPVGELGGRPVQRPGPGYAEVRQAGPAAVLDRGQGAGASHQQPGHAGHAGHEATNRTRVPGARSAGSLLVGSQSVASVRPSSRQPPGDGEG